MPTAPLVSVLVAVHDGEPFVRTALAQRPAPDGLGPRADRRRRLLAGRHGRDARGARRSAAARASQRRAARARGLAEPRRSTRRAGATSRAWTPTTSAFPDWLERSLALLDSSAELGLVGAGVLDIDDDGEPARAPPARRRTRRAALARALQLAVFHNTVVLTARRPRGARAPLRHVVRRVARTTTSGRASSRSRRATASRRRSSCTGSTRSRPRGAAASSSARSRERSRCGRSLRSRPSSRARGDARARGLARRASVDRATSRRRRRAFVELERTLRGRASVRDDELAVVRAVGGTRARPLAHARADGRRIGPRVEAARLDPLLPGARRRASRAGAARSRRRARRDAADLLRALAAAPDAPPIRVAAVFPEPTPYRAPLLDRVAALPEIDLTVVYAAGTVAGRTWRVEPKHRAVFLRGLRVPGRRARAAPRLPAHAGRRPRARATSRPDVVVVSGWSTFAAQAAIAWCRLRSVPYVLVVESHDEGPRPGWRRTVKDTVVPPVVANASGVLVTGTLARNSMVARGAPAGARARVREHGRRRGVRRERGAARADAGPSCGARSARMPTTSSSSPSRGSRPRRASTCSCARSPTAGDPRLAARPRGRADRARASRAARARARRAARAHRRRRLGADRRALRRGGRLRAPLRARAVGGRRERGGGVRAAARALRPRRAPRTTCSATARTASLVARRRRRRRRTRAPRARRRPGAAPGAGRALARARARLGLRPERRGLPRRPCARPSRIGASLLAVADGGERKRILVLNQYYWPGVEATAHLLTELCEALAEDYEVEVVTGVLHGHEDEPRQIEHNGVRHHARRVDVVRALGARPARRELLLVPRLGASPRAERPRARPRALHDRPADHRRPRRRSSASGSARRCSSSARTSSPRSRPSSTGCGIPR